MKNLISALVKAQEDFAEPKRTKQGYGYKYAPMDEVRAATVPTLKKYGLCVYQAVQDSDNKLSLETRLMHESGEQLVNTCELPLVKKDAQAVGSAITYMRRYQYLAILNLAPEDDDGHSAKQQAMDSGVNQDFQDAIDTDFPRKEEDTQKGPNYLYVKGKFRNQRNCEIDFEELQNYFTNYLEPKHTQNNGFSDSLWRETYERMVDWINNYEVYQDIEAETADER